VSDLDVCGRALGQHNGIMADPIPGESGWTAQSLLPADGELSTTVSQIAT